MTEKSDEEANEKKKVEEITNLDEGSKDNGG